ncbi:MAG: pyridoxamine 5'-phosphate oxidase family protein [Dehalococcoidia bacterium]
MVTAEQRAFLEKNRLVVIGFNRKKGPPHMTPVYYALDGDDIIMSTTRTRFKTKAIRRNPDVSLCVLGEQPPFPYLLVYGKGVIEDEGAVDVMMRVGERMTGQPIGEAARLALEERATKEGRVVLRFTPESFHPR